MIKQLLVIFSIISFTNASAQENLDADNIKKALAEAEKLQKKITSQCQNKPNMTFEQTVACTKRVTAEYNKQKKN